MKKPFKLSLSLGKSLQKMINIIQPDKLLKPTSVFSTPAYHGKSLSLINPNVNSQFSTTTLLKNYSYNLSTTRSTNVRSSHWRSSIKKVFLKFRKIHRKTSVPEFFINKVAGFPAFRLNTERYTVSLCV